MKITDLPMNGTYKRNEFAQFEWERFEVYPNTLLFRKIAECENPDYEAVVTFPNGIVNFDDMNACDISMGTVNQDGGESGLDEDWFFDIFDSLMDHLTEQYGKMQETDK
jgi:hypothetical protein